MNARLLPHRDVILSQRNAEQCYCNKCYQHFHPIFGKAVSVDESWVADNIAAMPLSIGELFFILIPTLQVEVLARWLESKEVGRLDSALCGSGLREQFLKILLEEHCVFEHTHHDIYSGYIPWIIKRHIKVSHAELPRFFNSVQQTQLFQTTGKYLRKLNASDLTYFGEVNSINNIVSELFTCNNLEELIFSGCDLLKANICGVLHRFSRLRYLDLMHCKSVTSDMILNINKNVSSLQTLMLSGCDISDETAVQPFSSNYTIQTLEVLGVKHLENLIPFILQCKGLRVLYVDAIQLSDLFSVLKQCPKIRTLVVSVTASQPSDTSDASFDHLLAHMQGLEILQLHLGYEYHLSDEKVHRVVQSCPHLRIFITGRLQKASGSRAPHSFENYETNGMLDKTSHKSVGISEERRAHRLQTLVVSSMVTSTLHSVLSCCPDLTSVVIGRSTGASTDRSIWGNFISTISNSSLMSIEIGSCSGLRSADLLPMRNLTCVSLKDTELKHSDVVGLITRNPQLKKLCLLNCMYLTHETLLHIVEKCVHLEELRFNNIEAARYYDKSVNTDLVVKFIKLHRPKLKVVLAELIF